MKNISACPDQSKKQPYLTGNRRRRAKREQHDAGVRGRDGRVPQASDSGFIIYSLYYIHYVFINYDVFIMYSLYSLFSMYSL